MNSSNKSTVHDGVGPLQQELFSKLWDSVSKSDPRELKKVGYGSRKFLAIDAYSQIRTATKTLGPMGIGFGLNNTKYNIVDTIDKNGEPVKMMIVESEFWYRYPNTGIVGVIELISDVKITAMGDFGKKVMTDLLTKGLSYVGFNADVFTGQWDDNKYDDRPDIPAPDWMIRNLKKYLEHEAMPEAVKDKVTKLQIAAGWTEQSVTNSLNGARKSFLKKGVELPELEEEPKE